MSTQSNKEDFSVLSLILTIIGVIFIFSLIAQLIKKVRDTTSSEIVTDEGKQILNNPEKRKQLTEAIEHYHQVGNWEKLDKISS